MKHWVAEQGALRNEMPLECHAVTRSALPCRSLLRRRDCSWKINPLSLLDSYPVGLSVWLATHTYTYTDKHIYTRKMHKNTHTCTHTCLHGNVPENPWNHWEMSLNCPCIFQTCPVWRPSNGVTNSVLEIRPLKLDQTRAKPQVITSLFFQTGQKIWANYNCPIPLLNPINQLFKSFVQIPIVNPLNKSGVCVPRPTN